MKRKKIINYKLEYSTRKRDERGFLVDVLKADELTKKDEKFGQMYFVTFEKCGVIRGNHVHKTKKEWFVVGAGKILVVLEDVKSKERETIILDGDTDEYQRLFIGENVAHAFTNLSPFAYMINYCNKAYHHEKPDSNYYELIKEVKNGKGK